MSPTEKRSLEKNLVKYSWMLTLIMRVYYPILGVYLVSVGKLSLTEIATIAGITALINLILQMPAGYLADKLGNDWAMKFGSTLSLTSPLWYIILPNFWGALIGMILFTCGNTFIGNGTAESLFHDTLVKLGREKQYTKLMGRAQSYGLIGNVIAVSLVPLTYPINHNLPFLIGFIAQILLFYLIRSLSFPKLARIEAPKKPIHAIRSIVNWGNISLFLLFGFVGSLCWATGAGEYMQLHLGELGVTAGVLGFVQAGGSLMGAILGLLIHFFEKIEPRISYLLDLLIVTGCLFVLGLAKNAFFGITVAVLFMGWIRVRKIVFQAQLLSEIDHVYKATLISALSLFSNLWQMVVPAIFAWSVASHGHSLSRGYIIFAGISLFIGLVLWSLVLFSLKTKSKMRQG